MRKGGTVRQIDMKPQVLFDLRDVSSADVARDEAWFLSVVNSRGNYYRNADDTLHEMKMSKDLFYRLRKRLVEKKLLVVTEEFDARLGKNRTTQMRVNTKELRRLASKVRVTDRPSIESVSQTKPLASTQDIPGRTPRVLSKSATRTEVVRETGHVRRPVKKTRKKSSLTVKMQKLPKKIEEPTKEIIRNARGFRAPADMINDFWN